MQSALWTARGLALAACVALLGQPAWAHRERVEEVPLAPALSLLPAAAAPSELAAPILSGLDYTAIAPPGVRLRVIEDEPYTYLLGSSSRSGHQDFTGVTRIVLRADLTPAGWYEAEIGLRYAPPRSKTDLRLSFDAAAHWAYVHAMLFPESRGSDVYSLAEVRSPLGLGAAKDQANRWREYLAYDTAVINPNGASFEGRATPYQFVCGELRVLRELKTGDYLLSVTFSAQDFPYSLTLTENIARAALNLLQPHPQTALPYLAYYPEYETAVPYFEGEPVDPRTADLAERPGEGCGVNPLPITGDVCPQCSGPVPVWPAQPYGDAEYRYLLPPFQLFTQCSKLLLQPWLLAKPELNAQGSSACTPAARMMEALSQCAASAAPASAGACPSCRAKQSGPGHDHAGTWVHRGPDSE